MKTNLISVSYQLEVIIIHDGGMGLIEMKKKDIPSLFFPINIVMNPRGPFEQVQLQFQQNVPGQMFQQPPASQFYQQQHQNVSYPV